MFWRLRLSRSSVALGFLLVIMCAGIVTHALVNQPAQFQGTGNVHVEMDSISLEVYSDAGLTSVLTAISWGTLAPGESRTVDVWVKNTGNVAVQLSMWTDNWVPAAAESQIFVTWDYDGSMLSTGLSEHVRFTLSVDPGITGITSFSQDIWVRGD